MEEILHIPEVGRKRIVIVGGGFGGLKLARKLLGKGFQIVLLDRNNYHQFQPLFYQVATAGLEPSAIAFPFRKIFQNQDEVHVRMASFQSVDPENQVIITDIGVLRYDILVIATGATTNYFNIQGIRQNSLSMKSVADAIHIRNTILHHYEQALNESAPEEIESFLNIVIVGGGPTGVELAGAIAEMKKYVLPKDYPELDFSLMKIYLFEAGPALLSGMTNRSSVIAGKYLQKLGVHVQLNAAVRDFDGEKVHLANGEARRTNTLIWAAGVTAEGIIGLGQEVLAESGRILTDEFSRVQGYGNIYAIGDIALTATARYPKGHPQVAPVAIQQARLLASNLIRQERNRKMKAFRYRDKGTLATVGLNRAVAELPRLRLKGYPAWLLWTFVHLMSIVGVKNRLFIFVNWAWNYITFDQSLRLLIRSAKN